MKIKDETIGKVAFVALLIFIALYIGTLFFGAWVGGFVGLLAMAWMTMIMFAFARIVYRNIDKINEVHND